LTRREAIAALAYSSTVPFVPLMSACAGEPASSSSASTNGEGEARALLDEIGNNLLRLVPATATSLGIDTGARAELRAQLTDRSAEGPQRTASQRRRDLDRVNGLDGSALSHATRTSLEVVRSAYATALEGFTLPYGDVPVGGWRITPYVVIQNVGAYLDIPRFAGGTLVESLERRTKNIPGNRAERARGIAAKEVAPALEVASEVDRYCSWPGQACGYKVGHSEINRQRERARTALGSTFADKAFNDTVVLGGNVPLDVLAKNVDEYIRNGKGGM
jgi:uncharacterized protein (DUF885 family)